MIGKIDVLFSEFATNRDIDLILARPEFRLDRFCNNLATIDVPIGSEERWVRYLSGLAPVKLARQPI